MNDIHYMKDDSKPCKPRNNTKFEVGQTVLVKSHVIHSFKPKYLMDYRVLKILSKSTLLLVTPNGRKCKTNINDVSPVTTLKLIENAWDSFLNLIKTVRILIISQNSSYTRTV